MAYPTFIFWGLFAWSLLGGPGRLLVLLMVSLSFGSLTVLPLEITGGTTLLPTSVFAVAFVIKVLILQMKVSPDAITKAMTIRNTGVVFLYLMVSLAVTVLAPRLFQGEIVVVPMKVSQNLFTEMLAPSQQNVTQSAYVALSILMILAMFLYARMPSFETAFLRAILAGSVATVVTGMADLVADAAGAATMLDPFRNASYSLLTTADVLGVKRVIGLMPEASTYGGQAVTMLSALALTRHLYRPGVPRLIATASCVLLLAFAILSTSSTAYVGLAIFAVVYIADVGRRLATPGLPGRGALQLELSAGILAILAGAFTIAARPDLFGPLFNIIDEVVFRKAASTSYYERSLWTDVSWRAFLDSSGFGVGLGSTRASNWFVALPAASGVLGGALMAVFLFQIMFRLAPVGSVPRRELMTALKLSFLPALGMSALAGTSADLGVRNAIVLGAILGMGVASVRQVRPVSRRPSRPFAELGRVRV